MSFENCKNLGRKIDEIERKTAILKKNHFFLLKGIAFNKKKSYIMDINKQQARQQ